MMGIAHKGVAFPVAWKVLPNGGGSSADAHMDVVERFLAIVDPEAIKAVVADREFIGAEWLLALQEQNIPFAIRLPSDRRVGHCSAEGSSEEGPTLPVRMFARRCCSARCQDHTRTG